VTNVTAGSALVQTFTAVHHHALPDLPGSPSSATNPCRPGSGTRTWPTSPKQSPDERAARRLARAIQGKGAFRRFKDELHEEHPELLPAWYAFRDARATRRAVQWLADNSLIGDEADDQFLAGHPDPALP
jgi:hypothetical protein